MATMRDANMFTSSAPAPARPSGPARVSPLTALIQSLSGAAANTAPNAAARQQTILDAQGQLADYDKESAFADAQGLINQALAQQMAASMPTIVKAADGAGASGSSMTALLTQKAVTDAATAAAALGAQQAVDYGSISAQNTNVLEALTRSDPTALNALLEALSLQNTIRNNNNQGNASKPGSSARTPAASNSQQGTASIRATPNSSNQQANGLAQAVFLPSSPTVSTDSFFNRPGGVLGGRAGSGMVSGGPTQTDAALLALLQQGLAPSQTWEGTPVPGDLFNGGLKF